MAKETKTYLDLFLENVSTPKKRGTYFGKDEENAIISFNTNFELSERERRKLFDEIIQPSFKEIINGVLEMPRFHRLGKLNREELIENTFHRMIEKMHKFKPGMISKKSGLPVKAFSYFSTIAKNHILEQKVRFEKILKHKADVESSIDLSILSEDTLQKMSNYDKQDVSFDSYHSIFQETSEKIIYTIKTIIKTEEDKDKPDHDLIRIGYYLKKLIENWDKIEFMKKNEFMRLLALYTGLKQQQVSLLFKKYKVAVLENITNGQINKNKLRYFNIIDEEEEDIQEEEKIEGLMEFKYEISSMEEFEIEYEKHLNNKIKEKWMK